MITQSVEQNILRFVKNLLYSFLNRIILDFVEQNDTIVYHSKLSCNSLNVIVILFAEQNYLRLCCTN